MTPLAEELVGKYIIEFCNYIQPIVTGYAGFIKTDGYMTHIPGVLILMSSDETFCTYIELPAVYNITISAKINTFMALKEDQDKMYLGQMTYFVGRNIKERNAIGYLNSYRSVVDIGRCIYSEDDCTNILGFNEALESTEINNINVSDGVYMYRIPASKSITPLSKGDSASLKIYETENPGIRVCVYSVFKKKHKLTSKMCFNIIVI